VALRNKANLTEFSRRKAVCVILCKGKIANHGTTEIYVTVAFPTFGRAELKVGVVDTIKCPLELLHSLSSVGLN
jgi:hypothetical protein